MQPIETAVMGRIVAGLTHEMNNILTIVQENAGLTEDLLDAGKMRGEMLEDRIRKAVAGIHKQVGRGTDLMAGLNRFAHTLDGPETALPPNEIARLVLLVMSRSARSRQVELVLRESSSSTSRGSIHSRFLLAVCACIEQFLEADSGATALLIQPEETPDGIAIRIAWGEERAKHLTQDEPPGAPPGWDGILSEIGVTLTPVPDEGAWELTISIGRCDREPEKPERGL